MASRRRVGTRLRMGRSLVFAVVASSPLVALSTALGFVLSFLLATV